MAECELPSFSLGFDLDSEDTSPHSPKPDPTLIVPDSESDPETRPDPPRRIFKRLRRGLSSSVRHQTEPPPCIDVDDDDIEEFSDEPVQVSACSSVRNQNSSISRSSKVSLKSIGVLTPHSCTNSRDNKRKLDLEIPDSVGLETGQCGSMFRKLMASPLRRFQLIESDDDDDVMVDEDVDGGSKFEPSSSTGPMCNRNTPVVSLERDSKKQFDDVKHNKKDLPIHLSPVKNFSIPRDKQASAGLETGQSGSLFPNNGKLEASPLRRFQLIESDDDDDMVGADVNGGNKLGPFSLTGPMCNGNKPVVSLKQDSKKQFDNVNQNKEDLLKNFPIPRDKQASAGLETGQSGSVFPNGKLAASPLRRFQLVDSDDDDDVMVCEAKVGPSSSTGNRNRHPSSLKQDKKVRFVEANQNQKHLSPVRKNFSIPTPAFNDVCEEYFHSAKNTQVPKSNETYRGANSGCQKDEQMWEAAGPLPPAHRYFFHDNTRIQQLVCSRLCNFSPLGDNTVNQQENIDYMGQFDNGGSTSRRSKSKNLNDSEGWVDPKIIPISTRKKATKRNNTKKNNETSKLNSSNDSANWVEPKDAGQRRVQASGEPAGHWYTGSDGRKVYVNKSGKESTGRNAYRNYRKESGEASKISKKKTTAKKRK
ncbi:uncharacterized protein LOC131632167 [Vicia villosa]|uniref:uncharacterized protein LOC131632167 n=1 Tax=Vicia villosa TaxID=3911 RepID=UPI00273CBCFA|nr:uncharacterized protein LOC131632167 [Vicia villosa]